MEGSKAQLEVSAAAEVEYQSHSSAENSSHAEEHLTPSSEPSRPEIIGAVEGKGSSARYQYTREKLLEIRSSRLVKESPISLESEIFRELQVDDGPEIVQPVPAKPTPPPTQHSQMQELPSAWKEDGWRANRYKQQGGPDAGSPPQMGPIRSRLVNDGVLAGVPDKEKGPAPGPQPRPGAPGWRRGAPDWRVNGDAEEPYEGWRPGPRMPPTGRDEGERGERERWPGSGKEETWRPPPPGLGRGQPRGPPPGLVSGNSNTEQWERPWGAGRGRPADGERRVSGKPRDPPGVLPPREQTREPGTRPQLPEGWNKPRDPDARPPDGDWRTGRVKEQGREQWGERDARWEGAYQGRPERQSEEGGRRGPAWMSEAESSADGLSLAERRRKEFEAERKAMQEERQQKSSKLGSQTGGAGADLVEDDEIEAMRKEAMAEELAEKSAAKAADAKPGAAAEAESLAVGNCPAANPDFNVDSLFADTDALANGGLSRSESREESNEAPSRAGRWFQLEPSPGAKTAGSAPLPEQQQLLPGGWNQQAQAQAQHEQQLAAQSSADSAQLQAFLQSRALPASGADAMIPRTLLSQLQQGLAGRTSSASISDTLQQQAAAQGLHPGQGGKPRTLTDVERLLLEKQLISPRSEQGTPLPRPVQPQQQQQAFNAGNLPTGNALLALLQGQAMRGMDPKLQLPQRPRSVEPTFANPHPAAAAQQQHQNLLNGLYPNKQQANSQLSSNLLEQLKRVRTAQTDQQQQQQQQQLQSLQQQLQLQQQQQQQQGQNTAGVATNPLLAAFSAQMPRETSAGKPLADDLFSFGPRDQLNRLAQPGLAQPAHLGLGQGDRAQPLNSNPLTSLLQNQQMSQFRTSAAQHAPNAFSAAGYNFSQAGSTQLGGQGLGSQGFGGNFHSQQNPQPSFAAPSQGLATADAQAIARYLEQQRQIQSAQQAAQQQQQQQRLLQQQRLYQLQMAQQQQQAQQAAQQRAAQVLLQQQQQQQQQQSALNYSSLASRLSQGLTPAEAALRQQQMLQFQSLNLGGGGNQAAPNSTPNADTLARFFANSGGMSHLGGGRNLQ